MDEAIFARMVSLRRTLHRHPELSGEEHQTAETIGGFLEDAGLPWRQVAGTGIVCDLPGRRPDLPMVALRADMDALPVMEETGLPFASQHPGRMHACGHDGHSSILLGAAIALAASPSECPVRCLWQPAEESACGASQMIEAGVLDNVGMIFGGHIDPRYPSGHLVVTDGAVSASADHLLISINGRQGHGARPHETRDPIHAAAALIISLQSIVSREVDPASPAVVSICSIHAGNRHNIISGQALLEGTIRAQDARTRRLLHAAIHRQAAGIAALHRVHVDVSIEQGPPAIINQLQPTEVARRAANTVASKVDVLAGKNMGAEDFAQYLHRVPGCYIRFGAQKAGQNPAPAHSSRFDFDEAAMSTASRWMIAVAHEASDAILTVNAGNACLGSERSPS